MPRYGRCVYCGTIDKLTKDHVPPRAIFPDVLPKRTNLVTVKCCLGCNNQFGKHDKRFAFVISSMLEASGNVVAREISERISESPQKNQLEEAFWEDLLKDGRLFPFRDSLGNITKYGISYIDKHNSLEIVMKRLVKGFFYFKFREFFNSSYEIICRPAPKPDGFEMIYRPLLNSSPIEPLPGVFRAYSASVSNDIHASAWLFIFYDSVAFVCLTHPRSQLSNQESRSEK